MHMIEEASLTFRLRKNDETRNYILDEIKHNYLMSEKYKKYKKTSKYFNYVEKLLILASAVTGCVSIFAYSLLIYVPVGITSSAVGISICAVTAESKRYYNYKEKEAKT